jgi:hypothetical protein
MIKSFKQPDTAIAGKRDPAAGTSLATMIFGAEKLFGSPVGTRTYDPSVNSGDASPLFSAHVLVPRSR